MVPRLEQGANLMLTQAEPNKSVVGVTGVVTQATTPNLRKLSASDIDAVSGGLVAADANPLVVCKYPAVPELS
jgi:hypothetical protein